MRRPLNKRQDSFAKIKSKSINELILRFFTRKNKQLVRRILASREWYDGWILNSEKLKLERIKKNQDIKIKLKLKPEAKIYCLNKLRLKPKIINYLS